MLAEAEAGQNEVGYADVAQLAEQGFCKPQVAGSSPYCSAPCNLDYLLFVFRGEMPEWLKRADCKSAVERLHWFDIQFSPTKLGNLGQLIG